MGSLSSSPGIDGVVYDLRTSHMCPADRSVEWGEEKFQGYIRVCDAKKKKKISILRAHDHTQRQQKQQKGAGEEEDATTIAPSSSISSIRAEKSSSLFPAAVTPHTRTWCVLSDLPKAILPRGRRRMLHRGPWFDNNHNNIAWTLVGPLVHTCGCPRLRDEMARFLTYTQTVRQTRKGCAPSSTPTRNS